MCGRCGEGGEEKRDGLTSVGDGDTRRGRGWRIHGRRNCVDGVWYRGVARKKLGLYPARD